MSDENQRTQPPTAVLECEDCGWRWQGPAMWNGLGWSYNAPHHPHENYTERVAFDGELVSTAPAHHFKVTL